MTKFRGTTILLLVAVLASFSQHASAAAGEQTADFPLDALDGGKPIELRGLVDSQTIHIQLPQSWLSEDEAELTLSIRASELLDPKRSSLNISLNDKSVSSLKVPPARGDAAHITFPGRLFRPGDNELTFKGLLYLATDPVTNCTNWDDPSRWLTIDPGGMLHMTFTRRSFPIDLSNVPQLLVDPLEHYVSQGGAKAPVFVLPDQPRQDDLSTVVSLAYALGARAQSASVWSPEVIPQSQFNAQVAANRNVILVNIKRPELKTTAEAGKNFLAIEQSPWDAYHVALVIGDANRTDGYTPVSAIADPARSVLLHGPLAYLDKAQPMAAPVFKNTITFEDLGYQDRTVRGMGRLDLIYRLFIPYDVAPVISTLDLAVAHSPELDRANSSIMVYLNGFNVAGVLPTATQGTMEPVEVDLPPTGFRTGENFLRISLNLRLAHPTCNSSLEAAWATVFSSSQLEFSVRHVTRLASLKYFPSPFGDYPGSTFVVPGRNPLRDLGQMAQLSFEMGATAHYPQLPPNVITSDAFDPAKAARSNIIIVGMPTENAAIGRVNNLLPQPFQPGQNAFAEGYGVYLPNSSQDASIGVAEVIPSPWSEDGAVLVLTGTDAQGMQWTWEKVDDQSQWSSFDGNLMLVGSDQRSDNLTAGPQASSVIFQEPADVSQIPLIGPLLQAAGQEAPVPIVIAAVAALIIALAVIAVVHFWGDKRAQARVAAQEKERDDDE